MRRVLVMGETHQDDAGGIVVSDLRRSFGTVHAVRDVGFTAAPGRVTALVGPNGSGKTTLLLMLASLLAPDAGSIRIAGLDPAVDAQAVRGRLGWMPDALGAWGSLTSRETLIVTARLYGMPADAAVARAEHLIHEVDLAALADAPARVLSRGQKQRLGLARALVHDPPVLLLDEPASGLDPQARIHLRVLLRRFAAEGRTVLVSSHILSELEEIADDAVFLVEGRTVSAPPREGSTATTPWRIRVVGDPKKAIEPVAAALGIEPFTVGFDRRELVVPFAGEAAAAEALARIVGAGVPVAEFVPAHGDLERAFLELSRDADAAPDRAHGDEEADRDEGGVA